MKTSAATAVSILDAAERATQTVGYNGLSFRDVAAAVGVKSSSVHYHFPTKGRLGAAVARRYTDRLAAHLSDIDARGGTRASALAEYIAVFRDTLEQDGRMCLCGLLAAETDAVPEEVRAEVRRFVDINVEWIERTLRKRSRAQAAHKTFHEHAATLFAALEGAMLIARGTGDIRKFDIVTAHLDRSGLLSR